MKPFAVGERVVWTVRDHGKDKRFKGHIMELRGPTALIDIGLQELKAVQTFRLNRCRGRKPQAI